MRVSGQRHAPSALPLRKTRYPLCGRLGGPQGRSERVRKISLPPGLDPRTVQAVGSHYTDWAIPAQPNYYTDYNNNNNNNNNNTTKTRCKRLKTF